MAQWSKVYIDKVILSEVNWPLKGTHVWFPIGSPYQTPGTLPENEPGVSETAYADYMIRYLSLALCSGMVEQVYWWRLSAKGYGWLDDQHTPWQQHQAFVALKTWLSILGNAFFTKRLPSPEKTYLLQFKRGQ